MVADTHRVQEQQKLRELRTSIVTAARDVQYRLVFLQYQLRTGALSADRALALLREISKKLGLESMCGAADAVTRLQRLIKELSAERVALDQRLLLARFVEIGQIVRAARKELMTNYDVELLPLSQMPTGTRTRTWRSQPLVIHFCTVDPGYALSACTMELEHLYTCLAEEVRTLEEAIAYARLVRAIKKFIKGQDLLPAAIVKPTPSEKVRCFRIVRSLAPHRSPHLDALGHRADEAQLAEGGERVRHHGDQVQAAARLAQQHEGDGGRRAGRALRPRLAVPPP